MSVQQVFENALKSKLLSDPYVSKIWDLVNDSTLFEKSPDYLRQLRKTLLREALLFFSRRNEYYAKLLESMDIDPVSAELDDVAKLAIPSDILRGDGQKPFLIKDVEPGGEYFRSSGTTGKELVKIYRSPLDLAIMVKANTALFEYVYGDKLEPDKGVALFMAAEELRHRLNFVSFVHLSLEAKNIKLIYGMDLQEGEREGAVWQKLVPNKDRILSFLRSKEEPKLFFTAPAGVYLMAKQFETMNIVKRLAYKLASGAPPVNLGRGGLVVTGGGSKGISVPSYEDVVKLSRRYFKSMDKEGKEIPTPFMDVFGMTETLTAFIDNYGKMDKVPYPLSEVFLLDPKTFQTIKEDEKEGILGIFNPFTTSWLELFYPGDIMLSHQSDRFYGKEYRYIRRLSVEEGWDLQRACGGTLEEMMSGR